MPDELLTTSSIGPAETPTSKLLTAVQPIDYSSPHLTREVDSAGAVSQMVEVTSSGQIADDTVARLRDSVVLRAPLRPSILLGEPGPTLYSRQLWEGVVRTVRPNEFVAVVRDRTNPNNPDEEVTFDLAEVAPIDRLLLNPGATFYWYIGYERTLAGTQKNLSELRFRRLPGLTTAALQRAQRRAEQLMRAFGNQA